MFTLSLALVQVLFAIAQGLFRCGRLCIKTYKYPLFFFHGEPGWSPGYFKECPAKNRSNFVNHDGQASENMGIRTKRLICESAFHKWSIVAQEWACGAFSREEDNILDSSDLTDAEQESRRTMLFTKPSAVLQLPKDCLLRSTVLQQQEEKAAGRHECRHQKRKTSSYDHYDLQRQLA